MGGFLGCSIFLHILGSATVFSTGGFLVAFDMGAFLDSLDIGAGFLVSFDLATGVEVLFCGSFMGSKSGGMGDLVLFLPFLNYSYKSVVVQIVEQVGFPS